MTTTSYLLNLKITSNHCASSIEMCIQYFKNFKFYLILCIMFCVKHTS